MVGVLAVHGAVSEHVDAVRAVGGDPRRVGSVVELDAVQAVVIPGGESTTIRLAAGEDLLAALARRVRDGLPALGTCAGLIALADHIAGGEEPIVGGLDVTVERNGYGRQVASFEAPLEYAPGWDGDPEPDGVFIRAPRITHVGDGVDVVARCRGDIVAVRRGDIVGTAYHPELTGDRRLHAWIVGRARAYHPGTHA
ncbi:MAG: pyridoxal 5'-phosphate synthase glutaminase subunit PdxT [Thermoleophilia bacterium]|nr:pyridoxal 5'-phosphate synthase glutaminase subunit PdxT [Thermoleophilia bacterium]